MTNSAKPLLSAFSRQPSIGQEGALIASLDQISAAPSSAPNSFKRSGSMVASKSSSTKRAAKSFSKVEKNLSMTPRFSISSSAHSASKIRSQLHGTQAFDHNPRSESIAVQHRTPIGGTLVTELPRRPSPWPTEFKDEPKYDLDEEARHWRRRIEASLRMYPRNTWGPVTKWGYLDGIPGVGIFKEKEHFKENNLCNHDRVEKDRIQKRDVGFVRNWTKYRDPAHLWENDQEACQSLAYGDPQDQYARNAERMLHAQNHLRLAIIKKKDERRRSINNSNEFTRLKRREQEYVNKIDDDARLRKCPGARKIKSSVTYNILAPDHKPADEAFGVKVKKWHAGMRALRIQSKQSGARMYDVVTWKPQRPCRVPPPKPDPADIPQETPTDKLPAVRIPSPVRPRNMLHGLDRIDEVPVGSIQDNRTNR